METVNLSEICRHAGFPYQIQMIGRCSHELHQPNYQRYYEGLEICLRLDSHREYASDVIDGETFVTPIPHVVFKYPGSRHTFHVDDYREALFFVYPAETVKRLEAVGMLPEHPLQKIEYTGELKRLISVMYGFFSRTQEFSVADRIDLTGFAILEELLFQRQQAKHLPDNDRERITKILSDIHLNFRDDIDWDELAKRHGFSRRSFFRCWADNFDLSPAKYLMQLKLKAAAELLANTDLTVVEISRQLNFSEGNYFSKKFKLMHHCTPVEYRRQLQRQLIEQ